MVPPKLSILIGFSIINHPCCGYPYFWKPPLCGVIYLGFPDQSESPGGVFVTKTCSESRVSQSRQPKSVVLFWNQPWLQPKKTVESLILRTDIHHRSIYIETFGLLPVFVTSSPTWGKWRYVLVWHQKKPLVLAVTGDSSTGMWSWYRLWLGWIRGTNCLRSGSSLAFHPSHTARLVAARGRPGFCTLVVWKMWWKEDSGCNVEGLLMAKIPKQLEAGILSVSLDSHCRRCRKPKIWVIIRSGQTLATISAGWSPQIFGAKSKGSVNPKMPKTLQV